MNQQTQQTQQAIKSVISRVAKNHARKCWWVDERDLQQEGWVTALEVLAKYQPATLDHTRALTWTAVTFTMRRHLWWASAPVSAGRPNRKKLAGMHATELHIDIPDPGDSSVIFRLRQQLHARAVQLLSDRLGSYQPLVHCVLAVLLEGQPSRLAAQEYAVSLQALYRATGRGKQELINDQIIYQLLVDISEQVCK